jgi:hypothetical protein
MWNLARGYVELKRYAQAAAMFEEIAGRDHENQHEAWFAAGDVYDKKLKDDSRARLAFAQVPPMSPRYGEAQRRLRRQ